MTKQDFKTLCTNNLLILDGSTGSALQKAGMPGGVCPEQWILEHPDTLRKLQNDYIEAGSHILYAPTFGANRPKLAEHGLEGRLSEINAALVALTKEIAANRAYVAGNLSMCGQMLEPYGDLEFEELVDVYKEQISCLSRAGVDLLVAETLMDLEEAKAVLIAAGEVTDIPMIITMTFAENGRTLFGNDAKTVAAILAEAGADAVGANCGAGPDSMTGIITDMASACSLPLVAKPNAGLPTLNAAGETIYDMGAADFAGHMQTLIHAGARLIGGCCGTDASYIAQLKVICDT